MFERYCAQMFKEKPPFIILSGLYVASKHMIYYSPADVCFHRYLPHYPDYQKKKTFDTETYGEHDMRYRYEVYALQTRNP